MTARVGPESESGNDPPKEITQLFGMLKSYLKFSGYSYEQDKRNKSWRYLLIVYCVFCNSCAVFNAIRIAFVHGKTFKHSPSLITSVAYTFFYAEVAWLAVTATFSLTKTFNKLLKLFEERYDKNLRPCPKMKMLTRVLFLILTFSSLELHVGGIIIRETVLTSVPKFDVPFNYMEAPWNHVGTVFGLVAILFGSFGFHVLLLVFNIISFYIYKEFAFYSSEFKELYHGPADVFESEFQELWDEHVTICDLLQEATKFLKHYTAASYTATIPILFIVLYGLIKVQIPNEELGYVTFFICVCIFQLANTTLVGVLISDKEGLKSAGRKLWQKHDDYWTDEDNAHEPLQHIFRSKWKSFSGETLQKLSLFASRLSSERIGYSVYGIFIINRSAILMVCGTILTYLVVVLQFQTDTDSGCEDSLLYLKNLNLTHLGSD